MLFKNDAHREFYEGQFEGGGITDDCYHRALVYTLGICEDTRSRFSEMYDKKERGIKTAAVNAAWQTSGSLKTTRLAFNLFSDRPVTAYAGTDGKNFEECRQYSLSDIFCCEFAPYFVVSIKLRYPECFQRL